MSSISRGTEVIAVLLVLLIIAVGGVVALLLDIRKSLPDLRRDLQDIYVRLGDVVSAIDPRHDEKQHPELKAPHKNIGKEPL